MYEDVIPQMDAGAAGARYRRRVDLDRSRAARLLRRVQQRPQLHDPLLAAVFVAGGLVPTTGGTVGYQQPDRLAVALILVGTVPYALRRRAPLPVFLCSLAGLTALFALEYDGGALPGVVAVGAYTVGAYRPLHEVLAAAAAVNAALVGIVVSEPPGFGGGELAVSSLTYGAVLLLGWTVQSRRLRLEALEREQGEAARRAAADERLRIAQDLHDVVAHSLGVIAVQAGVGAHVIDEDPGEARKALENISRTSRSSLAEVRALLGLLRSDDGAALAPAPGLADLARLAEDIRDAGLDVELDADGVGGLPAGVELAAYRIVQEALTNALRHAHANHATVRLDATSGALRIAVSDDGGGRGTGAGAAGGHGLVGMRERVAAYGGSLTAGPSHSGGFRVDACVPLGPVRR
jgi:signal transduction histidine kinase